MNNKKNKKKSKLLSIFLIVILIFSGLLGTTLLNIKLQTVKAASTWTQTSDVDFENGNMDNLTLRGSGKEAELTIPEFILWSKQSPSSRPSNGIYFVMSSIYSEEKVIIFGGFSGGKAKNETWIYDVNNNTWTQKMPNTDPGAKFSTAMAAVFGTKKVVLFGGSGLTGGYNDTWVYNLNNNTWTNMKPAIHPSGKRYHAMASVYGQDKVIMYGGQGGSSYSETWIYDLSDNNWTLQSPAMNPGAMVRHSMANVWGQDKAVLYTNYHHNGETWVYDVSDNNWTKKTPTNHPPPRDYPQISSISGTDNIMLFGGFHGLGRWSDDTWKYDLSDNNWIEIIPKNPIMKPDKRRSYNLAAVDGTNKVVLFGGYNSSSNIFDDTWIYRHPPSITNGTYVSAPYDTGSKSDFNIISWFANIPENTNIKLQLRTAVNGSNLVNQSFVGPDGINTTFYTSSPTDIWSGHDGHRWIQLAAYFTRRIFIKIIDSPSLKDVVIYYNCLPNTIVKDPVNNTLLSNNKPTFKWNFEDLDSEQQKAFQVLIDNDYNFLNIDFDSGEQNTSDERWEFPVGTEYKELPDGIWYWKIRTKDEDDYWTNYSIPRILTIDTNAPNSAPIIPINNGFYKSLNSINGTASDPIPSSGLNKIEVSINRLNDNYYWNGSSWVPIITWLLTTGTNNWIYDSSLIPWTSGTQYNIRSRAIDNATNIELTGTGYVFNIDMDRPQSKIIAPKSNSWLNKIDTISGNVEDISGSGIDKVEITIQRVSDNSYWFENGWIKSENWLTVSGTEKWSYNSSEVKWTSGDQYIIRSRAVDKVDNIEIPKSGIEFYYDDQLPSCSITINNNDNFTTTPDVILSLQHEDFDSGIIDMSFSLDGKDWSSWEIINSVKSLDLPTGDGEKIIYYRVRDLTGNIAEPVFDTIIFDSTPPEDLSIVINDGTEFTNSIDINIILTAKDITSGINSISFSYNGKDWLAWENFTPLKFITLPKNSEDGNKTIFFRAIDNAGNLADPVSDSIIFDNTPPYSLSILIDKGAFITNSTFVTLDLSAKDNLSGVAQISFSIDGKTWTSWGTYSNSKIYKLLGGDGNHTIYFKVMDQVGNVAKPVSASILLNTSAPQIIINSPEKEKNTSGTGIWIIILIVIIIIIVLIGINYILSIKRKLRVERGQELLPAGALTIKPVSLTASPAISVGNLQGPTELTQLAAASDTSISGTTTSVPMLTKSTQTGQQQIPATQQSQQPSQAVPQLPQLPPAQIQTQEAEVKAIEEDLEKETITTPIPTPTVTQTPASQPSPQVTTSPIISESEQPKPQTAPTPQQQEAGAQQQPSLNRAEKPKPLQQP